MIYENPLIHLKKFNNISLKNRELACLPLPSPLITSYFPKICFRFSISSSSSVIPFPIFSLSDDQSLISYFVSRSFQLTRFNSFVHPFGDSDSTPMCSITSYLISAIPLLPFHTLFTQIMLSFFIKLFSICFRH